MHFPIITGLLIAFVALATSSPSGETSRAIEKRVTYPVYTTDDHLIQCGMDADINVQDCQLLYLKLYAVGDDNGGWWTSRKEGECSDWKYGNCKATFCPGTRATVDVFMEDFVAGPYTALGDHCTAHGKHGRLSPSNATYDMYISTADW